MMRLFWHKDRFSWPFVTAIVLLTAFVVITDWAWRLVNLPIGQFLGLAVGIFIVVIAGTFGAYRFLPHHRG